MFESTRNDSHLSFSSLENDKSLDYPHRSTVIIKAHSGFILFRYWLHMIALAATAAITTVNILNLYFIDSDDPNRIIKLNAFQFVAKTHEIIVAGSLMMIVMDCVRSRLISPGGVSLGYVLAPVLFNDLDWLVSPEFWSCLRPTWQTLPLTLLILVAIPFVNLAGPLSAILIVPRQGWSQPQIAAVFPNFWNASANEFWPQELEAKDLLAKCGLPFTGPHVGSTDIGCPNTAARVTGMQLSPEINGGTDCTVTGARATCNFTMQFGTTGGSAMQSLEYSEDSLTAVASMPAIGVYRVIAGRFQNGLALSQNISDSKIIEIQKQELVTIRFIGNAPLKKTIVKTTCSELSYPELYSIVEKESLSINWTLPNTTWISDVSEDPSPAFLFTYLRNSSALTAAEDCEGQACYAAIACSIDARWTSVEFWYNTLQPDLVYQSDPSPMDFHSSSKFDLADRIVLRKSWLTYFDQFHEFGYFFSDTIVTALNDWDVPMREGPSSTPLISTVQRTLIPTNYTQGVSVLLTSTIATLLSAVSRNVGDSRYNGDCNNKVRGFSFEPEVCGSDPIDWMRATSIGDLVDRTTMMTFLVQRFGYGWFMDSVTVRIALGVWLVHALFTILYLLTDVVFRRTITTRWVSASELLVLAINSYQAPKLAGCSTGVKNKQLWHEPVTIREVTNGGVSLTVGDPADYNGLVGDLPQVGKAYA